MKIEITSTDRLTLFGPHGACREWEGVTEDGNKVTVMVAGVFCSREDTVAIRELVSKLADLGVTKSDGVRLEPSALSGLTPTADDQDQFESVWRRLAEQGHCDEFGSNESVRVFIAWIGANKPPVWEFIIKEVSRGPKPDNSEGESLSTG